MTTASSQITRDLLLRIANGDEHSFRIFFNELWPQVYGTSLRLTRSPEQAKDLSQEIFLRVWENRTKLPEVTKPESYLYILSRNYIMDHLRKKVFDPSNTDYLISYFSARDLSPQQQMEYRELESKLRTAINTLPEKQKEVFRLSREEGLTHEQIAARLNISAVSSKTYMVRALQHIRQYLEKTPGQGILLFCLCHWLDQKNIF
jgi:RNA polymerase sigma-70 factor (family 1)